MEKGKQQERLTASERIEQLQQDHLEESSRLQKDHALHIQSLQRKLQLDMDGLSTKHEDGLQEVLQQQEVKDQTILELRGKLHKSKAEIQELELKYQEEVQKPKVVVEDSPKPVVMSSFSTPVAAKPSKRVQPPKQNEINPKRRKLFQSTESQVSRFLPQNLSPPHAPYMGFYPHIGYHPSFVYQPPLPIINQFLPSQSPTLMYSAYSIPMQPISNLYYQSPYVSQTDSVSSGGDIHFTYDYNGRTYKVGQESNCVLRFFPGHSFEIKVYIPRSNHFLVKIETESASVNLGKITTVKKKKKKNKRRIILDFMFHSHCETPLQIKYWFKTTTKGQLLCRNFMIQ